MRILALDHGTKRIGVAISDETAIIAQPLEFLAAAPLEEFLKRLEDIIDSRRVGEILVGIPRNMNGTYGPAAARAREFAECLKGAFAVPVKTWDERLTTVQATRFLIETGMRREQRKTKVDQTAAAIMLQSYLDSLSQ
jgi:putative Holliday junction resolvase